MRNEMDASHELLYLPVVHQNVNIVRPTSSLVVINAGVNAGEGLRKL